MKVFVVLAFIALLAFAGVEARKPKNDKDHHKRAMASSKTFVSVSPSLHRFCIPIGKTAHDSAIKQLSLHTPRSAQGFTVKLDTTPGSSFSSPASNDDKFCKKVSTLMLVNDAHDSMTNFKYHDSEIQKNGAISGFIVGQLPEWISVRMLATEFEDVEHAKEVCHSVLGKYSEEAFDAHHATTKPRMPVYFRIALIGVLVNIVLALLIVAYRIVKRCRARKQEQQEITNAEMVPMTSDQEERDLAMAIERSLADEQKVVEVPQTAAPQFVFVPPPMMPGVAFHAEAGVPAPYVPMFAPQFMNYSLEQHRQ